MSEENIMEGCGKDINWRYRGEDVISICDEYKLCESCKNTLKGTSLSEKRKELLGKITQEFSAFKCTESKVTAPQKARYVLGLIEEQDQEFIKKIEEKSFVITDEKPIYLRGRRVVELSEIDALAGVELSK